MDLEMRFGRLSFSSESSAWVYCFPRPDPHFPGDSGATAMAAKACCYALLPLLPDNEWSLVVVMQSPVGFAEAVAERGSTIRLYYA